MYMKFHYHRYKISSLHFGETVVTILLPHRMVFATSLAGFIDRKQNTKVSRKGMPLPEATAARGKIHEREEACRHKKRNYPALSQMFRPAIPHRP